MKQQEQLKAMEQYAKRVLSSDTTGHDWSHIERVVNTTKTIAEAEKADLFICEAAAILHDVIDDKILSNSEVALNELKEFLASIQVLPKQVKDIEEIITRMSFKNHKENY